MQNDAWFALLFIYLPWIWPDDTRYDIVATADYALYNIQAFVCSLSLSLVWVELIVECGVVSFIELLPLFSLFCLLESQHKCISVLRFEYSYKDSINWLKRSIKSKLNKIKQSKAIFIYKQCYMYCYCYCDITCSCQSCTFYGWYGMHTKIIHQCWQITIAVLLISHLNEDILTHGGLLMMKKVDIHNIEQFKFHMSKKRSSACVFFSEQMNFQW